MHPLIELEDRVGNWLFVREVANDHVDGRQRRLWDFACGLHQSEAEIRITLNGCLRVRIVKHVSRLVEGAAKNVAAIFLLVPDPLLQVSRHVKRAKTTHSGSLSAGHWLLAAKIAHADDGAHVAEIGLIQSRGRIPVVRRGQTLSSELGVRCGLIPADAPYRVVTMPGGKIAKLP